MNPPTLSHNYHFDPSHGYSLDQLLAITPPQEPADFVPFWQARFASTMGVHPKPQIKDADWDEDGWRVFDLSYQSTNNATINGWLLIPGHEKIRRGFVISHGYGGRLAPDFDLPFKNAALLFPCLRGMHKSPYPPASSDPRWHVLHDIQDKNRYIHGGCVEDTWQAVSALLRLKPELEGHIGYLGISFGGGIGALALPWDHRIARAHLNVPSFGHHPLRLKLGSVGSAASVQQFAQRHPSVAKTLSYFDAAVAAKQIKIPLHCALAGFDPFVAPAGQYAIYNALAGPKELFNLTAGHHDYPDREKENRHLLRDLKTFFKDL